jgi:hypothetical protein
MARIITPGRTASLPRRKQFRWKMRIEFDAAQTTLPETATKLMQGKKAKSAND